LNGSHGLEARFEIVLTAFIALVPPFGLGNRKSSMTVMAKWLENEDFSL
jgi:hypothetical protein